MLTLLPFAANCRTTGNGVSRHILLISDQSGRSTLATEAALITKTPEHALVSLEAQQAEISRYAERNNLSITKWFVEKETAAKSGCPIFNQVVRELKAGRAHGLIVHLIDRSTRNFHDWAAVGDLADSGIQIHFTTGTLDFASRSGRLTGIFKR